MIKDFFKRIFDTNQKQVDSLKGLIDEINSYEYKAAKLKDDEIKAELALVRVGLKDRSLDDYLPWCFALTREASNRALKMRPYDVQMMASIVFHQGKVAEQKTGEGKTLSAVPAIVLNALTGKGVHVVTVNDYLARRDAGWMGPIYHLLGLSVGVIYSGSGDQPAVIYDPEYLDNNHADERLRHFRPVSRTEAYAADITYGTNNEFGFDYLRDNMVRSLSQRVQRGHHFAIVDEVDSILIDEARTPLIISAPDSESTDKYYQFASIIGGLSQDTDYEIDEKQKSATLTEHGLKKLEKVLKIDNIYEKDFETVHHVEQALKARTVFEKDRDYIVKDDQVIIVDEHTGRLMYGRRFSDGLHQAIEAKEGVKIQQESRTLATVSLQNYFRMYQKLAGMTGTAATEAEEFNKIYGLETVVIPTHRPVARKDFPDVVYKTTRAKYTAIADDILETIKRGQPVLIGTKSIEQNQILANYLKRKKIPHQVLNAKNHEKEAEIIANAGLPGAVTVATNIAGRGVDIVLGGDPSSMSEKEFALNHELVIKAGGLHVIGAVRHESRRIDNQLRGRSGRQGDPGSSRFYVSLDDEIMRIFGGEQVMKIMEFLNVPEDQPLEAGMVSKAIETAQGKVESFHFDQRKSVVDYDDVVNKQREIIYGRRSKILEAFEDEGDNLKEIIMKAVRTEVDNLTLILSPNGITEDEHNQLINGFMGIIPLDNQSQKELNNYLKKEVDPNEINKKLMKIVELAYDKKASGFGSQLNKEVERFVILDALDSQWIEHLDSLTDLRDGIGLRGYAQKDPLVEYKQEAFSMFESLLYRIDSEIARRYFKVQLRKPPEENLLEKAQMIKADANLEPQSSEKKSVKRQVSKPKIGRNDPCWCGSGKKYKVCHLNSDSKS